MLLCGDIAGKALRNRRRHAVCLKPHTETAARREWVQGHERSRSERSDPDLQSRRTLAAGGGFGAGQYPAGRRGDRTWKCSMFVMDGNDHKSRG